MQEEYNDPTALRPEGKRLLHAPQVKVDLKAFIILLKDEKTWKTSDRNAITVFKTDGMRIVLIALHKNAIMQKHKAKGIICFSAYDCGLITHQPETNVKISASHRGIPGALQPGYAVRLWHHTAM